MAEDIVTQLEWLHSEFYDVDSVTSIVELAKAEIKRLCAERDQLLIDCAELRDGLGRKHDHAWRMDALAEKRLMEGTRLRAERDASRLLLSDLTAENERLQAENKRLRAADQYVEDLGVDWCVLHHGVRNEDSDRCDAFDWADGDDMLDEDGEYLPCDLRPLAYREARRD